MKGFFRTRKLIIFSLGIIIGIGYVFFSTQQASAQFATKAISTTIADIPRTAAGIKDEIKNTFLQALLKAGKISFLNSLRSLVNKFAYDTATYLGSGGQGQKPVYFTQEFGPWLRDQAFNVGGQFIEEFAQTEEGAFIDEYNICSPDLAVNIKIALGLTDFASQSRGLDRSRCDLKRIYQSGVNQIELYSDPSYLKNLAITAFDPTTTDVGAAFTLFDQIGYRIAEEKEGFLLQRREDNGWVPAVDPISQARRAPPGQQERLAQQAQTLQTENFFTQTGDIFVDAANIFLNQLALSAFNKLIDGLSGRRSSLNSGATANYYQQGGTTGITEIQRRSSSILQARFNERVDYDVLSELSSCPNENSAGPTNCVITDQFAQAVTERLTVAEAINRNIIDPTKRLGFTSQGGTLSYLDGYPYRSLIILQKYRILPVGWGLAAQYIKDNASATKDVTLGDLINCFDTTDSYQGLDAEWCRGLIDPNWVLKIPKQYCGMEGYGPEILQDQVVASDVGYCIKGSIDPTEVVNCDPRSRDYSDAKCATNYVTCFSDSQCSGYVGYEYCDFTIKQDHQIVRDNTYCADEQSCIKENPNGSCAYYGYCTEEKRRWVFNQETTSSCEARNNTCQSFKSDDGRQANFLENTLNYDNCDASQVGCKQYDLDGPYVAATKSITWDGTGQQAFFNGRATQCNPERENCHQFIRIKDGLDTNLIADGSFETSTCIDDNADGNCDLATFNSTIVNNLPSPNNRWYILRNGSTPIKAGIVNTEADTGTQSLYIEGDGGWFSQEGGSGVVRYSVLPNTFIMEGGYYYTLSARVFVTAGRAFAGFGYSGTDHVESTVLNQWQTLRVTYYKPVGSTVSNYFVMGRTPNSKFYIDSIKLTVGRAQTDYSEYGENNVIYQKLLPNYLAATCYDTGGREPYTLKANAPEECKQFARQCNDSEVGCEAFRSVDSGLSVTGKVQASDYCPQSCVGYNTFVQQPNAFNPRQAAYFIPRTARACSASAVGCTAFTNLDKIDQGGEAIEYYTELRRCIKPDATRCSSYYTWEGSDESGYQLKVYSLEKDSGSRLGDEPLSTLSAAEEQALCNETIFRKLPTEAGYNYDCRQFYAQDGTVSYHLLEKTITCSDDCHPYRRELTTSSSCTAAGGEWDATQSRCLYYAIPGEGRTCAAVDVGCSEYTGNVAGNTRNVFIPGISTFESNDNPLEGWFDSSISRSNTSLTLGGHSILGVNFAKVVGSNVTQNNSYNISFLGKAVGGSTTMSRIELINESGESAVFSSGTVTISTEWKLYSFNLGTLDHLVSPVGTRTTEGEKIRLQFSGQVYLDNVKLTEIPNRYFLIKNSWTTPAECDQDLSGASSSGYMLGCSQYQRSDQSRVNLKSFSDLCSDTSAGCEAMIDTHNSTDYRRKLVNDSNNNGTCDSTEIGCLETPADTIINVIYDRTKQCGAESKGCQRMGQATTYNSATTFTDVYVKNDPDVYSATICKSEAVGCSKWTTPEGDAYFKDPGDEVCEWRLKGGTANEYNWYQKKVMRCGGSVRGNLCTTNSQCTGTETCQLENEDTECNATPHKTLGEGGRKVMQPAQWAGICDATQVGCTELIDPSSTFNANLIRNPDYQPNSTGTGADFWEPSNDRQGGVAVQSQTLNLHTTYILKGSRDCYSDVGGRTTCRPEDEVYINDCRFSSGTEQPVIYQLRESDNTFEQLTTAFSRPIAGWDNSLEFYIASNNINSSQATVSCNVWRKNRTTGKSVELREAVVGYQLRQYLDTQSPNGLVSYNKGYILFNQRTQNGKSKAPLLFNVDETGDGGTDGTQPKSTSHPYNANVIIKVQADRTCSKWLDCASYIPDPNDPRKQTCLEVGLCDSLNSEGQCNHFIDPPTDKNENILNLGDGTQIANLTGYSKVGYYRTLTSGGGRGGYGVSMLSDYYNLASMRQKGTNVPLINADFEFSYDSKENENAWVLTSPPSEPETRSKVMLLQPAQLAGTSVTSSHVAKNRNGTTNSFLPPSGSGIVQVKNGNPLMQDVLLEAGATYTISAYVYNQGGGVGEIYLMVNGTAQADPILTTIDEPQNQWIHKAGVFTVPAGSTYSIQLFAEAGGDVFFDLIAIESGLSIRCTNRDQSQGSCTTTQYIPSSCRLFPTEDALSCQHVDSNNITHKGLKGYCLEYDPNFPDTCLLWYPLDKIAGDKTEEGLDLDLPTNMYYCLKTDPICPAWSGLNLPFTPYSAPGIDIGASAYNAALGTLFFNRLSSKGPDRPIYQCSTVAKVDSEKYWRTRVIPSSSYLLTKGAVNSIHFVPSRGGDITRALDASNIFGHFLSLSTSTQKEYTEVGDLSAVIAGTPYTNSNDSKVCKGYTSQRDNLGNVCTEHVNFLGEWESCSCDYNSASSCLPWGNCTDGTYGCNMSGWRVCTTRKNGTNPYMWEAVTTDQEQDGGSPDYSTSRFDCSSRAGFTYHTSKSAAPQDELLRSIFTKAQIFNWNGSSYASSGTIDRPLAQCSGIEYLSFCTGSPITSCTSDAGCVGKGTCFMRRKATSTSADFSYPTDYCFIPPKVFDFTVNGLKNQLVVTDGSQEVNFAFNTKADPDQLPLTEIGIHLGYRPKNETDYKVITPGPGNYNDGLRNFRTSILSYRQIRDGDDGDNLCSDSPNGAVTGRGTCGNKPCCFIKPKVIIKDNWGYCNGSPCGLDFPNYIRVDQN